VPAGVRYDSRAGRVSDCSGYLVGDRSLGWGALECVWSSTWDSSYINDLGLINIDSMSQKASGDMRDLGIDDNGEMSVLEIMGWGK
jgi:hypothetical protein